MICCILIREGKLGSKEKERDVLILLFVFIVKNILLMLLVEVLRIGLFRLKIVFFVCKLRICWMVRLDVVLLDKKLLVLVVKINLLLFMLKLVMLLMLVLLIVVFLKVLFMY